VRGGGDRGAVLLKVVTSLDVPRGTYELMCLGKLLPFGRRRRIVVVVHSKCRRSIHSGTAREEINSCVGLSLEVTSRIAPLIAAIGIVAFPRDEGPIGTDGEASVKSPIVLRAGLFKVRSHQGSLVPAESCRGKVFDSIHRPDPGGTVARACHEDGGIIREGNVDDVAAQTGVGPVEDERRQPTAQSGTAPHLHMFAEADGKVQAVGAELDAPDASLEAEAVQDDAPAIIGQDGVVVHVDDEQEPVVGRQGDGLDVGPGLDGERRGRVRLQVDYLHPV